MGKKLDARMDVRRAGMALAESMIALIEADAEQAQGQLDDSALANAPITDYVPPAIITVPTIQNGGFNLGTTVYKLPGLPAFERPQHWQVNWRQVGCRIRTQTVAETVPIFDIVDDVPLNALLIHADPNCPFQAQITQIVYAPAGRWLVSAVVYIPIDGEVILRANKQDTILDRIRGPRQDALVEIVVELKSSGPIAIAIDAIKDGYGPSKFLIHKVCIEPAPQGGDDT